MRDAARSGSNKRWALSNWDLRWKVTAVLAVPLLVAVVLGASRISAEFADSSRLSTATDHVGVIPAITGLSADAAQVAGGQMVMLGPTQSLTSDPELAQLDTAISFAERAASRLSDIPSARQALDEMIVGAKAIRSQGLAPSKSIPDSVAQVERIRGNSVKTVENIVSTIADKNVDQSKLRLVDSLNSRWMLFNEVAGMAEALRNNPKEGLKDIQIGVNTERQMLAVLAHRFADGDPIIADLQRGADTRVQLVNGPQAQAGQLPIAELKDSLVASINSYQTIATNATKDIVSRVDDLAATARKDAIQYSIIVIATILGAMALAVLIARAMIVPLRRLRLAALRVAEYDLGQEVSSLREGADPEDVPLEPMPVHTDEEIGQLARAVDDIHGQALRLAADQAAMRTQVNDMFETLARRSKSLVDHQLSLIEAMEYDEKDPRLLENLFRLDHLAARMRRNGDNLLILAGTKQRRTKSAPVEIADVLRAAISEVEDYERVKLGATPRGSLVEPAASDLAHLFAELLDNALRASPPETDVKFTFAQAHDQGLLIEVADRGIGMPPAEMAEINRRLEAVAEVGPDTARHMGLFVVGRLAERHGLTVRLRPTVDTARDPGVTVTVHVPKPLIVSAGGAISVPPQPQDAPQRPQPAPAAQGAGNQAGTPSSMQMRAVTRTATGNVMVTVDPGVSGPIPAGTTGGAAPTPAAASAATGLPTRQPGAPVPGGLPTRQPGVNGPTIKHTVSAPGGARPGGLPQRDPGAHGPAAPSAQPGANLPQRGPGEAPAQPRGGLAANMLKRQGAPGGMPPRPGAPGEPGAAQRGPEARGGGAQVGLPQPGQSGAMPQRNPSVGLPPQARGGGADGAAGGQALGGGATQWDSAAGGLPPGALREPGAGGLPTRQPGTNGAPGRESGLGQPQRPAPGTNGAPQRDSGATRREPAAGGLPQRDSAAGGLPPQVRGGGAEPGAGGLPTRQPGTNGAPQQSARGGGAAQRGAAGPQDSDKPGLPQRDAIPPRDGQARSGGATQRGAAAGGHALGGGGAHRDASNGLTQQARGGAAGSTGADPLSGGLTQRDPLAGGLPQRGAAGGLPQRDAGSGLPQRDAGIGLPQRDSAGGLPQRGAPKPDPLSDPIPLGGGLPQRDPLSGPLSQRDPLGGAPVLPQRGSTGLPQRDPGSVLPQRPSPIPGVGLAQGGGATQNGVDDVKEPGRHSFRSNPQKAASFFQTRLQPADAPGDAIMGGTPIFAEMMSAWLSDPNADRSQVAASFESPGDEGWQAARRAIESTPDKRTAAGLPQRDPGNRLVPGGVNGNADKAAHRDPESIRSSLSRHQQGVRDGRAMKAMNLTGDKGDR
ncbi:HAMP domain-containing sensor histidine kinase [Nocardia seriolae]|uniref:HAMP domain-containing sensor histidine kinase n=1 Tax=Nocardia seriolae TaxID=37332 RepID=UPI00090943C7|nr:ATP-binding protein [Nocardia seriolae]MTJ60766.1 HAMP domain-containing protein [Nocardia seriolae]MTJ70297.1 HAMP domain-containing protein [Nocardia seriolae]MTJ91091.1 HAMP domain-containing protein [Nocardia seriolae]MTK35053.1 HAMP domain-containing protein [Nocardia seriolae]MTK38753.1 HAMP domain-containing protein [Nocardia seriolae]